MRIVVVAAASKVRMGGGAAIGSNEQEEVYKIGRDKVNFVKVRRIG